VGARQVRTGADDPHAVLGVREGASAREVEEAYRELAKRWHPDRGGGPEAELRMAQINVAHDLLRAGARHATPRRPAPPSRPRAATVSRRPAGAWLSEPVRRALGPELLSSLEEREPVAIITPTSLWKSPRAVLAVTDRRLLWLLDDAISERVRSLRFSRVTSVSQSLAWPRRRTANLKVVQRNGKRVLFADLTPATAVRIERHVRDAIA
jgi:hypothetical protein